MSSHRLPTPAKIISGGQTGVDRAALDVAIRLGISHGGWCPRGRVAEDGRIPDHYELVENNSANYPARTAQNVADGDATLVLFRGRVSGGTRLTVSICERMNKEMLLVNLNDDLPQQVRDWLIQLSPSILNIAGPRESTSMGVYDQAVEFLLQVFSEDSDGQS